MYRYLLVPALLMAGCSAGGRLSANESAPSGVAEAAIDRDGPGPDDNLHATLWTQTAVEYRAVALQAYRTAARMLEDALADTAWTAALEQQDRGGYGHLPPAVVLDVDETVLDNSAYQARLILDGATFSDASWKGWVRESGATAIPGALAFTRLAAERGVRVVYLTNRDAEVEAATRINLAALGFPISDDPDVVITQGERPEWQPSDKGPRRRHVAETHRILLLIGDNLTDFLSDNRADLAGRDALFAANDQRWGRSWIVLPNSQYGSWESATFGAEYRLSAAQRRAAKLRLLRTN